MSKQIQVSQLLATPDAQYINGDVSGHLTGIRPPNGRGPSKAKLQDATGFIEVSLWGGGVSHWENKQVTFSGKGMQIKEFRGAKQLSVGDKVIISQAVEPDNVPGDPLPAVPPPRAGSGYGHGGASSPARTPQTAPREPSSLPVNLPHGATVGMSIKAALDIWLATDGQAGAPWDTKALNRVGGIARQLVHLSQQIESGQEDESNIPF